MHVNTPDLKVLLNIVEGVATITLNRPDRLNAIDVETDEALRDAFEMAFASADCCVIVLTGAGRGFCAGAERGVSSAVQPAPLRWSPTPDTIEQFRFNYLINSPVPVIAAINGAAIGVGLVMACLCDVRLALDNAKLSFPYARLGLIAEYGIAKVLPNLIGASRAQELLLSGRQFSAREAQEMGLVSHIATQDAFVEMVQQYAKSIAQECSPASLRAIRRQLRTAPEQDLLACAAQAGKELQQIRQSRDYSEALNARRESRPPLFTGE